MRYLLPAIVLGALSCANAPAFAQSHGGSMSRGASMMISMMDKDEDGRVTADEWAEASFPPLVFLGAFLKLTLADYQETLTGTPEDTAKTARENFVKFDADKDGFLTGEEFRATFVADFVAMDADKDGNLSIDEYEKAQPR